MAGKKKEEYTSQAVTHSIRFTSRMSAKIHDTYYTIEACEERWLPEHGNVDVEKEKQLLWDSVNGQCEDQIDLIFKSYQKN